MSSSGWPQDRGGHGGGDTRRASGDGRRAQAAQVSWETIGKALGISRQAAWERFRAGRNSRKKKPNISRAERWIRGNGAAKSWRGVVRALRLRRRPRWRRCASGLDRRPQGRRDIPARGGPIPASSPRNLAGSADAKRSACASGTPRSLTQFRTALAISRAAPASAPSGLSAAAIANRDLIAVKHECGFASADRRHGIRDEHGMRHASQSKPQHRRIDVLAVRRSSRNTPRRFESGGDWPRIAASQRRMALNRCVNPVSPSPAPPWSRHRSPWNVRGRRGYQPLRA